MRMIDGTQRTACALQMARIAPFFIAMTGTPIIDSKGLIVKFDLQNNNRWVGANEMIAYRVLHWCYCGETED
jgi:hypothetical protein